MDWANERYVRVFTRDTGDWLMWPWETRALLVFIFRKLDRSGVLHLGKGRLRALSAIVGMPEAELTAAIEPLLEDGCIQLSEDKLVVPNFIEAQETPQSDKLRKQASREKARSDVLVTLGHAKSHAVTRGHAASESVTPSHSRPDQTRPDRAESGSDARATDGQAPKSQTKLKSVPPPPIDEPPAAHQPDPPDPAPSVTGYDLAERVWSELWRAKYGRDYEFGPRLGPGSESMVLQRVGDKAIIRGSGAETYLRHKIAAYLREHGDRNWLDEKCHPLRTLERDWVSYGEPKSPKPKASNGTAREMVLPPPPVSAERQAEVAAMVAGLGRGGA